MTIESLNEISQWVQRHGPGNCWTGTSGVPAVMLRELLDERHERSEVVKAACRKLYMLLGDNEIADALEQACS